MTETDAISFLLQCLRLILTPFAVTAGTIYLSRSYLVRKIQASVQHSYDAKLVVLRAELQQANDTAIEEMRHINSEQLAAYQAVWTTFQASHGIGFERQLKSVETLWEAFQLLQANTPPIMAVTDILIKDEYQSLLHKNNWKTLLDRLSDSQLMDSLTEISRDVELGRLFADQRLYAYFFAYRAIIGRIAVTLIKGRESSRIPFWPEDSGVKQYLAAVLTPAEVEQFGALGAGHYSWIRTRLEAKFLAVANAIVSGRRSLEESISLQEQITRQKVRDQVDKAINAGKDREHI